MRALALACSLLFLGGLLPAAPPDWSLNQAIYEINPEHYSAQGGFKAIEADLPRLKTLGVGILWLTPIQPRGVLKAFKSPYCIRDYDGIYPGFGTEEDFRSLVKAAHAQGLHLILDWVANHTSYDHPWVKQHPGWYQRGTDGQPLPVKGFIDIAQLNYESPALRKAMIQAMARWVGEYGVDGFRCDMAWKVPADFWAQARAALEKLKPVFLLAESNDAQHDASFDADYDWNLLPPVKDSELIRLAKGFKGATAVDTALIRESEFAPPPGFFRLRMTSNHDEWNDVGTPSALYGPAAPVFAVLMGTLPGKPLLYNGQELGWDRRYSGARTAWNTPPDPVLDFTPTTRTAWWGGLYQRLLWAYRAEPALNAGTFIRVNGADECRTYAYVRQKGADQALVVLNLSADPTAYDLEHPAMVGDYRELFSGQALSLTPGAHLQGRAEPWSYQVYLSGPAAEKLFQTEPYKDALSPGWSVSKAPVAGACATPVAYASPLADPKPVEAACLGQAQKGAPLERLASGVNPDDVKAQYWLHWDAYALYVDVRVWDRQLHAESSSPWEDDAIELYLNLDGQRKGDYRPGDFQYIFALDAKAPWEAKQRTQGVTAASVRDDDGWVLSVGLPWKTLGHVPQSGEVLGFDLGLDMNQDGNGRLGQLMLNGTSENFHTTKDFAKLKLLACP
jgi:glycosidase